MVYSGTGHRLELIGYENYNKLVDYIVSILPTYNATKIICGMALGFDQALAEAAIQLNIPFVAAVPFKGQEFVWPEIAKIKYNDILNKALEVIIVCEGGFATKKYFIRDHFMIDNSEAVIALYNGQKKGGTAATVKYAKKQNKQVSNIWSGWQATFENKDLEWI